MQVDPWAHFVNAYAIDRDGQRIERRDPETAKRKVIEHLNFIEEKIKEDMGNMNK